MGRCDQCLNWAYHYPDDMGVCTATGGPGDGNGYGVPMEKAVVSREMRTAYSGHGLKATTADSQCDRWEAMK